MARHHPRHPPDVGLHGLDDRDLVVPGIRLRLDPHAGRPGRGNRGDGDIALSGSLRQPERGLRREHRRADGGDQRSRRRRIRGAEATGVGDLSTILATRMRPVERSGRGAVAGGGSFAAYAVLAVLASFAIGPIVLFAVNSLKSQAELAQAPFGLPAAFRWENYVQAWTQAAMGAGLRNSVIVVTGTVVGVCVISGCAAYAMARLNLPGAGAVMLYLLASSALPIQ